MRTLTLTLACWLAAGLITAAPGQDGAGQKFKISPPEDRGYLRYPLRIMNRSTFEAYEFDPENGELATLSYSVSKSGWVRVRLVHRQHRDIVLGTLQDWTESHYGSQYRIRWDGTDASGNVVDRRHMFVEFESRDTAHRGIHETHASSSCKDPPLSVGYGPGDGTIVVDTSAWPRRPAGAGESAYRARLYADYELVDEVVVDPEQRTISLKFDRGAIAAGEHVFTINVDDFEDHMGAASLRLSGDRPDPAAALTRTRRESAPPLLAPDLAGRPWRLAEHRGKVLLLNFWATWCPPCRHEMPALESLYQALQDQGFVVVGVASDALGSGAVKPVAEQLGLSFPILLDPDSSVTRRYRVSVRPTSYLVDRDGMLVARMVGPQPWDGDELAATIRDLLASPSRRSSSTDPEES